MLLPVCLTYVYNTGHNMINIRDALDSTENLQSHKARVNQQKHTF